MSAISPFSLVNMSKDDPFPSIPLIAPIVADLVYGPFPLTSLPFLTINSVDVYGPILVIEPVGVPSYVGGEISGETVVKLSFISSAPAPVPPPIPPTAGVVAGPPIVTGNPPATKP